VVSAWIFFGSSSLSSVGVSGIEDVGVGVGEADEGEGDGGEEGMGVCMIVDCDTCSNCVLTSGITSLCCLDCTSL